MVPTYPDVLCVPNLRSSCFAGGRQVDGAIPSLYALGEIMKSAKVKQAQRSGAITILFDSGIRTGSDIIKALALGAQGVLCECSVFLFLPRIAIHAALVGRPWLYGMIVGGQAGVEQVIQHTLADLDTTLGLAGYRSLSEVQGKGEEIIRKLDL